MITAITGNKHNHRDTYYKNTNPQTSLMEFKIETITITY